VRHTYERNFVQRHLHCRGLAEKRAEAKAADLQLFNEAIDVASASDDE
jgi:hypothetical protein